jgi:uncharacterized repeat protein (TIGR04076 family)
VSDAFKHTVMQAFGFTEAEVDDLSDRQRAVLKASPARRAHKVIMEVVRAENCGCKPKVGDRYVTNGSGMLLADECTFQLCLWALAPLLPISYVIYDRLSHGQDPNGHLFDHVRCTDTGVACGGIGTVLFKVYTEAVAP